MKPNINKILTIAAVIAAGFSFASCERFFDVDLKDQANLDEIFSKSLTTHNYLAQLYSSLPMEGEIVGSEGWVVPRSDEAMYSFYQWVYYLPYKTGNYSSATPENEQYFNYWKKYYTAIQQCSIFMANVDKDHEDSERVREYMKAEARFLRAFYYFCLFRQYGPVFIWGDRISDEAVEASSIDRNTVDENVDFIVSELDKCIAVLPLRVEDAGEPADHWMGRATKGAAMAVKARLLLYAASPLYNGCDLYVGKMQRKDGTFLFPQTPDPSKWEKAAQAAKDIIELGIYDLVKNTAAGSAFLNGAASYQEVFNEAWNKETIFGWWKRTSSAYDYLGGTGAPVCIAAPPSIEPYGGFGGIAPSLKLVDAYPMWDTGRYPVKGYEGRNDASRPIVDPLSGYQATGFKDDYKQPLDADWAPAFKAHNSTVGRDPRYYACIVPNGFYWPDKNVSKRFTCYNSTEATSPWSATGSCIRVGFAWRKHYKADTHMKTFLDYKNMKSVHPAFRLAEVYLNYAEACNEKPVRDETNALHYLNLVRNRVGLNDIEVAYPEIAGNRELLRWCIRQERMVEFGMEAMRHYDACRWMIAKQEYNSENWTLCCSATTYEASYDRVSTDFTGDAPVFGDRDYLFPISSVQLAEMTNMTQNTGF